MPATSAGMTAESDASYVGNGLGLPKRTDMRAAARTTGREDAMISRRAWLAGAVASTAALTRRADAQAYPSRVIKMIVPFAPGGPADTLARLAAQQIST